MQSNVIYPDPILLADGGEVAELVWGYPPGGAFHPSTPLIDVLPAWEFCAYFLSTSSIIHPFLLRLTFR